MVVGLLIGGLALVGCDSDEGTGDPFGERSLGLVAFDGCDQLLSYFQAEAIADIELGYSVGAPQMGGVDLAAERGDATGAPAPSANDDQGGAGGGQPPEYSRTNTQEADVDEPDFVKTDGQFIYALRNGHFLIYRAADLALQSDTPLQGQEPQLFVDGDQAVVLDQRWGGSDEVFPGADADRWARAPRVAMTLYDLSDRAAPQQVRQLFVEGYLVAARLNGRTVRAVIQFSAIMAANLDDLPPRQGSGGGMEPAGRTTTPAEPPPDSAPMPEPIGTDEAPLENDDDAFMAAVRALIEGSTLDEWIPQYYDAAGDVRDTGRAVSCGGFYRPGERSGVGVTAVISLDLDRPLGRLSDSAVVTAGGVVYASATGLYIATTNYRSWGGAVAMREGGAGVGIAEPGDVVVDAPTTGTGGAAEGGSGADGTGSREQGLQVADDDRQATQLHKFAIDRAGEGARYVASGRVFGTVLNQFSLGEYQDHLRVATTEERLQDGSFATANHVFVLGVAATDDGSELQITGQITDLAVTERIYAVRFLGDRGYVVTFRQVDPLFTLDLSDPTAPVRVGELKVPGFSTYLHPLDEDHLLSIGQDATEDGRVLGMQLSMFDVTDFANPALAHRLALGEGWSDAAYDHKAFNYWAPANLLMIPVNSWNDAERVDGLELYGVDLDTGFERRGNISHRDLVEQDGYAHVERSLIIGETIYSVSNVGLKASDMQTFEEQARAVFPEPAPRDDGGDIRGEPTPAPPIDEEPVEPEPPQPDGE